MRTRTNTAAAERHLRNVLVSGRRALAPRIRRESTFGLRADAALAAPTRSGARRARCPLAAHSGRSVLPERRDGRPCCRRGWRDAGRDQCHRLAHPRERRRSDRSSDPRASARQRPARAGSGLAASSPETAPSEPRARHRWRLRRREPGRAAIALGKCDIGLGAGHRLIRPKRTRGMGYPTNRSKPAQGKGWSSVEMTNGPLSRPHPQSRSLPFGFPVGPTIGPGGVERETRGRAENRRCGGPVGRRPSTRPRPFSRPLPSGDNRWQHGVVVDALPRRRRGQILGGVVPPPRRTRSYDPLILPAEPVPPPTIVREPTTPPTGLRT